MEAGGFKRHAGLIYFFMLFLLFIHLILPTDCPAQSSNLTIGNYVKVSEKRISRTVYEYTYWADITNSGAGVINVVATVASTSPFTIIMDNELNFGDVPAGATVSSSDTFTFRQDRLYAFSWSNLTWNISFELPVNHIPTAVDDLYTIFEDTILTIGAPGVIGNDNDLDGDSLTSVLVDSPQNGTLILNSDGSFTYSHNPNFSGIETFSYMVSDGMAESNIATVTITVNQVNDSPVAQNDHYNTDEDTLLSEPAPGVLGNDNDIEGDPLIAILVNPPSHGTVVLNTDGSLVYTPNANYTGADSLVYRVYDGAAYSNDAMVTINVYSVNDSPIAQNDSYTTNEGIPLNVPAPGVLSNDTDIDGNPLTAEKVSDPLYGTVALNSDGSFVYVPNTNFNGTDSFTYRASDGLAYSGVTMVTITVNPVNQLPIADNQLVTTDEDTPKAIVLTATDRDGDPLTFSIVAGPSHGSLTGTPPDVTYSPAANYFGPDSFTFKANDGIGDSNIATVTITVILVNDPPIADAGPDQDGLVGNAINLNGSGSSDPDGDTLTYQWSIFSAPVGNSASIVNPTSVAPIIIPNIPGIYVIQLVVNDGSVSSSPDTVNLTVRVTVPNVVGQPQASAEAAIIAAGLGVGAITQMNNAVVPVGHVISQNPAGGTVVLAGSPVSLIVSLGPVMVLVPNVVGLNQTDAQAAVIAAGLTVGAITQGNSNTIPAGSVISQNPVAGSSVAQGSSVDLVISLGPLMVPVPNVVGMTQAAAESAITAVGLTVGTVTTANSDTVAAGSVISQNPTAGLSVAQGSAVDLVVSLGPTGLPPDPGTVAPPIDPTVATTMAASTEFLYTGTNPIQTGVVPGTIEAKRAAVLRGKVLTRDGNALSGVTITILNHPEFGQTLSRADGMFDLAVNGGGFLTINYQKSGYLSAQRQVSVPWEDYVWAPDVILIPQDANVTPIDLTSSAPIQVARGSVQTDNEGSRQATVLIRQGTMGQLVMPNGSTQPITSLNIRATEYTVGPNGPKAMPAELPPTSGYTYAVELSSDEALSAGATTVTFNQPLYFYVEDFIGFPVGSAVPTGYYDRQKGQWIASENGRVIKVLSLSGGLANVDTDGDGFADNSLAMTDAERVQLASLYTAGQALWRVPMTHFTPYDCNWPSGPPMDAMPPTQEPPRQDYKIEDFKIDCRSLVECQNQVLRERVALAGTPFTLSYSSARALGRKSNVLDIPLSGDTLPASLMEIVLYINVAGRQFFESFPPQTNLNYHFVWDGLDAYDRKPVGMRKATVHIGYVYPTVYYVPPDSEQSFGRMAPSVITVSRGEPLPFTYWQRWSRTLMGTFAGNSFGGWSLDALHQYDPLGKILFSGDGTERGADTAAANVIRTVAGNGQYGYSGDSGPATNAELNSPSGIAVGPDGSLYIADTGNSRIRRVRPDGIITTVAGNGQSGYNIDDGVLATDASLGLPTGVAVGLDGSIYISIQNHHVVRRVSPNGIITTVAGIYNQYYGQYYGGYSGDGGPATAAELYSPGGVTVGPDGSLFIADTGNGRIRCVGPDGIITTVAGGGSGGDYGPAAAARLMLPTGVAVGPDGSLFIVDQSDGRIRRVGPDGIITTMAGTVPGYLGDGGLATNARLMLPTGVAVRSDGSLYIADTNNNRIRRVGPDWIITTVAGTGEYGYSGDEGPGPNAQLRNPKSVAIGSDVNVYIADYSNHRIRSIGPGFPGFRMEDFFIASEDGSRLYVFDSADRHLRTVSALTGAVLYRFHYDGNGLLTQAEDGDGNITTVERDASGEPTAIVGPYGHRTTLTLGSGGYLANITNPAGETLNFGYNSEGLLTEMTDAKGNRSVYEYDAMGRLVKDTDAAGGSLNLARSDTSYGFDVTTTTALGEVTIHQMEELPTGEMRMVSTNPDGTKIQKSIDPKGTRTITMSDGTVASLTQGPDPRFGMQAPIVTNMTLNRPSRLQKIMTVERNATLSDPNNPLSLQTATDNVKINGRLYTTIIDMGTMQRTLTTPEGRKLVTTFDTQGRIIKKQVGNLNPVSYTYDARGRMAMITQGSGADARQFLITYNNQGYPATMSGPLSAKTDLEYNASGRVLRQILGDGRTVSYGYDAAGNIASITPPGKLSHLFTYSPINLAQEYTTPDAGAGVSVTTFTYDQDKKLTSMTRPDGSAITMAYDSAGRPATKTFDRGTLNYGYDPVTGMLSSLTAPDGGALTMEYDGFLTIKSAWTGAVTGIIDRVYDNNFWLTRRNVNDQAIDFDYENDGLLVQAGTLTLTRDVANGLVTATVLGGVSDTWHYTGFGELDEYGVTYNGSDYFTTQYIYDKLGRIVQKTEEIMGMGSNVYGYSYDVTSRLTGVSLNGVNISTYTYDSNGNRLSFVSPSTTISGSYDAQDRLTQYGDMTYTYTANGELESKTDAGGTTTYQYDSLGNLMSATIPGGTAIEYIIDGANRRIGKKVNNVLVKGLLYKNELKPVAELDGGNNVVSRFVFGSRGNVPDYMITNNATYRIISDHLGSPRLVIDVATGQIAQRLDYDEFGKVLVDTNPGFQPFGFAGGLYDPDTGLVRFGARDYDPQTGRWTAKDLILFLGGDTNLYAYALNNPLNYLDIDGRQGGVDPPPGTSEPRTDFGDGDWQEAAITQVRPNDPRIPRNIADGPVHVVVSCFHGTCTETVWDPRKEKSLEAQVSLDCQGTDCGDLNKRAFKQFLDFDPSNPFPGESLPPAQPLAPSSSLDLPPLVPIPLSSGGKSCNLNIWRDASGNIIDVIKVK